MLSADRSTKKNMVNKSTTDRCALKAYAYALVFLRVSCSEQMDEL